MTRVNINGSGHQIEVEHQGGDLAYVIEKAQRLWDDTKPVDPKPGPAFGYSAQVKLHRNGSEYRRALFGDGQQPVVEP